MSTAQERLQQGYYNSAAVSGANPGGLASGGHVPNFPAALQDIGVVAQDVGAKAAATVGAAQSAGQSAASAHDDRVLAQQAAQAAGQFDPSTKVSKAGDVMTGPLYVGLPSQDAALLNPGAANRSGALEFRIGGLKTGYFGFADANWNYMAAENGRGWSIHGPVQINGSAPFTPANDGSGSGLDADLLRGFATGANGAPNTVPIIDGNGFLHARGIAIEAEGFQAIYFAGNDRSILRDGNRLKMNCALYLDEGLSASVVTERSDRRLKSDIEPLEAVEGRLKPVRYVLNETGETKIGFIAQDIEQVRPEAVVEGALPEDAEDGAWAPLEVSHMALIAHLARQVNDLQDRLDKAGI